MAKLTFDEMEKRLYEAGVSMGVLYPMDANGEYPLGVAWNGLSNVTESPSGAEPTDIYADNILYLSLTSAEKFEGSIDAYYYPDEFEACDGSAEVVPGVTIGQQDRIKFGLCYRTEIGDGNTSSKGYKLNLVYGLLASTTEKVHDSINDSPELSPMSWDVSATPIAVTGFKPTAILKIDSTKVEAAKLSALEDLLYGTAATEASLPTPDEVIALVNAA